MANWNDRKARCRGRSGALTPGVVVALSAGCVGASASDDAAGSRRDATSLERAIPVVFDAGAEAADKPAVDSPSPDSTLDAPIREDCAPTPERCNGLDDDCDGRVDEPEDADPSCAIPQGRGACIGGRCYLAACDADRGDCDRDLSNGCETDLSSTVDHCGACGRRCGGFDACVTGVCGPMTDMDMAINHSCAVHSTGRVVCWGRNHFGQLGDGTRVDRLRPVVVQGIPAASMVRVADTYTCAVAENRIDLFCWGQRGLGRRPRPLPFPPDHEAVVWPPERWRRAPLLSESNLRREERAAWPMGYEGAPIRALFLGPSHVQVFFPYLRGSTGAVSMFSVNSTITAADRVFSYGQIFPWSSTSYLLGWGELIPQAPAMPASCGLLAFYGLSTASECFDHSMNDDQHGVLSSPFDLEDGTPMGIAAGSRFMELPASLSPPVSESAILNGPQYHPVPTTPVPYIRVRADRVAAGTRLCFLVRGEPLWRCAGDHQAGCSSI